MVKGKRWLSVLAACWVSFTAAQQPVWIDADTGNEMDDLFAIVYALRAQGVQVVGLSSVHFNNPDLLMYPNWNGYQSSGLHTRNESQRLNELLLRATGKQAVPHPAGADRQMGRAWGGWQPCPSPAVDAMAAAIQKLPDGERLSVLTLGALTNVASLVALHPQLAGRIQLYSLAARCDTATGIWNKNEFNVRNDLNAFDFLMDHPEVDWTIMPINVAIQWQVQRDATLQRLRPDDAAEQLLQQRWLSENPQDVTRILWDLALIQAWRYPQHAGTATVPAPPENTRGNLFMFRHFDRSFFEQDFWSTLQGAPALQPSTHD